MAETSCRIPAVCINCGEAAEEYRHGAHCPSCEFIVYLGVDCQEASR